MCKANQLVEKASFRLWKRLGKGPKNYECTSKNNSPDAKGWVNPFLVEGPPEVWKLRRNPFPTPSNSLIKLLAESPELNTSGQWGPCSKGWKGCRKGLPAFMCSQANKAAAIWKPARWLEIAGWEYCRKDCVGKGKNCGKGKSFTKGGGKNKCFGRHKLWKRLKAAEDSKRNLKRHDTEVSMENQGFPKMFGSLPPQRNLK